MKEYEIVLEPEARKDLENIYDFIMTNDTEVQARRFLRKLQKAIMSLNFMPKRCRQSIYMDGDNIRDMIIQGYTICYVIKEQSVHILAVFRQKT
jgi:plasmid stabilization system protein ParE